MTKVTYIIKTGLGIQRVRVPHGGGKAGWQEQLGAPISKHKQEVESTLGRHETFETLKSVPVTCFL